MATTFYTRTGSPQLWGGTPFFTVKDSARAVTAGADTFTGGGSLGSTGAGWLTTSGGSGAGTTLNANTVAGPTNGKIVGGTTNGGWFSPPIDRDFTLSGTVTFNICGLESNMAANALFRGQLYRCDSQGALTLVADGTASAELGTTLARQTFTATPTSTAMKKGDRLMLLVLIDDGGGTMASGNTVTLQYNGDNASTADSNFQLTETVDILVSDPTGTSFWLRDSASSVSGEKELLTTQGSGTVTAAKSTANGPIAFPGTQWTATAGGSNISWMTSGLNAFTLGGVVKVLLGANTEKLSDVATPFDALTVELAVVDADGTNAVVWARSYTCSSVAATSHEVYLTGTDQAVGQGKRLRLRIYQDDTWPNNQASGTTRTIRYDGTSTYESKIILTQSVSVAGAFTAKARRTMALDGSRVGARRVA